MEGGEWLCEICHKAQEGRTHEEMRERKYAPLTSPRPLQPGGNDGQPANFYLRIPCTTAGSNVPANGTTFTGTAIDGCPNHLPVINGTKYVAYDVAAWSDLWFYSNPIYIEVTGSVTVAGVK